MTWPLIERELRTAWRKRRLHRTLLWGTAACAGVTALFLLFSEGGRIWGRSLNLLLFLAGLFIISRVPSYTVGIFTEDRRNQTLGLLFLCGINSTALFVSKTLGSALVSFNRLLLLYPFLAVSFLSGGLSVEQFVGTAVSLPVLLFFVISVCTLASVLCQEESTAMFVASAVGAVLCLTTPLIYVLSRLSGGTTAFVQQLLALSPARPAYLAFKQVPAGTAGEFWQATAISIFWSGLMFVIAGFVLSRAWQDKPEVILQGSRRARLRDLLHGDAAWRRNRFERWEAINPFVWLAMRDRWLVTLAWIVIGTVLTVWLVACLLWPKTWLSPSSMFLTALFLNYSFNWLSVFAAAKTIGENRRSGGLELLLTTPLNHLDIVRGQLVALREQFRPVAFCVLGFELILLVVGILTRTWTAASLVIYLVIWFALIYWTGSFTRPLRNVLPVFWDSMICGRPAYVALKKSGLSPSPLSIVYFVLVGGSALRGFTTAGMTAFPTGSLFEFVLCGIVAIALVSTRAIRRRTLEGVENRLAFDLRTVAASPPPEPSDPRYKHWKSGEHFPEMLADMLIGRVLQQVEKEKRERPPRQRQPTARAERPSPSYGIKDTRDERTGFRHWREP
ncbi:MAG TPA: ABC transporter permease [Verrucomicrobiae bacterium]|nr:ABC transporter permease [Verrucomicrobiae bacterium]